MKINSPTIKDIAKIANVSMMTVSRALTNGPYVRKETKEKIVKIAKKMNYRPNRMARSLASNRSHLIGFIVANIENQFYAELASGIENKAHEYDFNVILSSTGNKSKNLISCIQLMMSIGVDGLILSNVRLHEPFVEELVEQGFPVVLINRKLKNETANYVVMNNHLGAYIATEHLINCRYKKIGIISGPQNLSSGMERLEGYKKALADHELPFNKKYVHSGPFTKEFGYEATKRMLTTSNRPEALFATSDNTALGVMKAANELDIKIPDFLGVVGFDDTELSAHPSIKLTTVSQKKYMMGELGVQILIDLIEREGNLYTNRIVLEPKLIIRESCGSRLHRDGFF